LWTDIFWLLEECDCAGEENVLGETGRWKIAQRVLAVVLVVILGLGVASCGASPEGGVRSSKGLPRIGMVKLSEVAPPPVIRQLRQEMEVYQPQITILSPKPNEVLQDTTVSVRLQVQDLPIFENEEFGLSPHLHVIVDNQPYIAVYDTRQPLELENLEPGTHTIRAFASRPWHESFKNDGAYAQTSFHIFTKTPESNPDLKQPLLTYSRPKGSYGAEPVMLDFYLANAPLHLVAQEDADDEIMDWQVRCTIDGETFTIDRWDPIYLKGLKPGKNWVQLELLDEKGKVIPNAFNNTVRLIDYQPGGTDTLSKLVRNELAIAEVRGIIDPKYVYVPEPEPAIEPVVEPVVEPAEEPAEAEPAQEEPVQEEPAEQPALFAPSPTPAQTLDTEPILEPVLPGTMPIPVTKVPSPEAQIPAVEALPEVEEPKQPEETAPPPVFEPPIFEAPKPIEVPITEKVKEQFPEEVEELLKAGKLEPPAIQTIEPSQAPTQSPSSPPGKPLLRQWRDRLKQVVPLPESDKSDSSLLKGLSNRIKGLQTQPEPRKTPEIIDIPATEDFQTPIATPPIDPIESN
jgi:hypothetical protein